MKNRDSLSKLIVKDDKLNIIEDVDMGDGEDGSVQVDVYYVDNKDVNIGDILPDGTIDPALRAGTFYIVYEVESGSVSDVFYWEKEWTGDFENFYKDYRRTSRSTRMNLKPMAGYYGGDAAESGSSIALRTPVINIYNNDELKAEVTWWIPRSLFSEANRIKMKVTLEYEGEKIVLSDEAYKERRKDETSSDSSAYRTLTSTYLLDSLYEEDMRFREFFKDTASNLKIGKDFTITAEVYYDDSDSKGTAKKEVNGASKTATDNSLFAKGYGDKTSGDDTAYIEYTRHLQNLREAFSQNSGNALGQTAAVQIADITCPEGYSFEPILSKKLQGYNGQTYEIRNLNVEKADSISLSGGGSATVAGLFGAVKGEAANAPYKLENIYLVNASIGTTAADYAGALAGMAENAVVLGCRSYWENDSAENIGLKNLLVSDDGEIIYKVNGKNAGGLFGSLTGSSVKESLAASTVEGTTIAGGLAAVGSNVQFVGSYADCYLAGSSAAGLIGSLIGVSNEINTCYTAGFITGDISNTSGAGLCLGDGSAKVSNSYTAMSYQNHGNNAPLCGSAGSTYVGNSVYYLHSSYVKKVEGHEVFYQDLTDPQWCKEHFTSGFESKVVTTSHPYNLLEELSLTRYPYPGIIAMDHYGDWTAEFKDGSLVYYEEYKENGVSSYGFEGANLKKLSEKKPIKDGYAIAFDEAKGAEGEVQHGVDIKYTYTDENGQEKTKEIKYSLDGTEAGENTLPLIKTERDGKTYYLAPLPEELVNSQNASNDFYQKLSYTIGSNIKSEDYYYNPHFACTALDYDENLDLKEKTKNLQVRVRTPRHLNELSKHEEYYASYNNYIYLQELDLDYAYYTGYGLNTIIEANGQDAIGRNASRPFRNTYNGGCHIIINLPVRATGNYVGLFGYSSGVIRNVVFLCDEDHQTKITRSSSASGVFYAGGLAGYNNGSIHNSAVADMSMELYAYQNSTAYVGGFVGYNHGTITTSEAALKAIRVDATYSNAYAGGFAGCNSYGGSVTNCYGVGRIKAARSRNGIVYASGFAAMNQGTMRNSYCAADLTVSGGAEKFGFCKDVTINCYYLNQGNFIYDDEIFSAQYEPNGKAIPQTWKQMTDSTTAAALGFSTTAAVYNKTETVYPYPGVVKDANGQSIHYGDWPLPIELGIVGVCYWEKEVTYVDNIPVNTAYHFSAISVNTDIGVVSHTDTLCTEHDDGGVIEEYGYGYFYTGAEPGFEHHFTQMLDGAQNTEAARNLQELMGNEYSFVVYTTARAGDQTANEIGGNIAYTFLAREWRNGNQIGIVHDTWKLTCGETNETYSFYVNPFFGDSIAYAKTENDAMKVNEDVPIVIPGSSGKLPYGVRSVEQLEFINWNLDEPIRDVNTVLSINNCLMYPYLSYYHNDKVEERNYYWKQSHDLDGMRSGTQTPIAEFLDATDQQHGNLNGWFSGTFDGDDYVIANVNIQGQKSSCTGLFGVVYNGTLKNIIMYSEDGTGKVMSRSYDSGSKWFGMGALAGLAASSSENSAVQNCSVAGYTLYDNHVMNSGGWGGSGIGGLLGISNMQLTNCSAVTDIVINSDDNDHMRIGGLVGACQQSISNCYAGGEISFNGKLGTGGDNRQRYAYIGGIVGGIYFKPLKAGNGNIGGMETNNYLTNSLINCYSYVTLPKRENDQHIGGLFAVGGPGELTPTQISGVHDWGDTTYSNCYYLRDVVLSENDGIYPNVSVTDEKESEVHAFSYEYMSDGTLLNNLNANGAKFSTVTTRTDDLNYIDGKYSFATSNILTGLNYPFPTILTQANDTYASGRVNVHYGNWPLSGLQREHGNLPINIDVFADYEKKSGENTQLPEYAEDKAIARESISLSGILKSNCPDGTLSVSCTNVTTEEDTEFGEGTGGTEGNPEDPVAKAYFLGKDETGKEELQEEVFLVGGKLNNEDPVLIIEGLREGTSKVTVKYEPSSVLPDPGLSVASLEITVNVTAVLQLRPAQEKTEAIDPEIPEEAKTTIEPLEEAVCFAGNSVLTELYAFDSQGKPISEELKDKINMTVNESVTGTDIEHISKASCTDVIQEDGVTRVPCRADLNVTAKNLPGATSVIVEYTYKYLDKTYQASSTVNISIREMEITAEDVMLFLDEAKTVTYDTTRIKAEVVTAEQKKETIDPAAMTFLSVPFSGDFYADVDLSNPAQVIITAEYEGEGIIFPEISFYYGGGLHTVNTQAAVHIYGSRLMLNEDALTDGALYFNINGDQTKTLAASLIGYTGETYEWEFSGIDNHYLTLEKATAVSMPEVPPTASEIAGMSEELVTASEVAGMSEELITTSEVEGMSQEPIMTSETAGMPEDLNENMANESSAVEFSDMLADMTGGSVSAERSSQMSDIEMQVGRSWYESSDSNAVAIRLINLDMVKEALNSGNLIRGTLTVTVTGTPENDSAGTSITRTKQIPVIITSDKSSIEEPPIDSGNSDDPLAGGDNSPGISDEPVGGDNTPGISDEPSGGENTPGISDEPSGGTTTPGITDIPSNGSDVVITPDVSITPDEVFIPDIAASPDTVVIPGGGGFDGFTGGGVSGRSAQTGAGIAHQEIDADIWGEG